MTGNNRENSSLPESSGPGGRHTRRAATALLLALLAGCAGEPPAESAQTTAERETVIEAALGEVGRPYRFGGDDTEGFDCSGLVEYSYGQAGLKVPRGASALREAGTRVNLQRALPGDLLFYRFANGTSSSLHVAIYLGNSKMVHAPSRGKQVEVTRIDEAPWPDRFLHAERLMR
ncbi:MAG: C40 family peptidase [Nevskia sp.]|nr:C40 family peptidase [Nevskia sp.]